MGGQTIGRPGIHNAAVSSSENDVMEEVCEWCRIRFASEEALCDGWATWV